MTQTFPGTQKTKRRRNYFFGNSMWITLPTLGFLDTIKFLDEAKGNWKG